MLIKIRNKSKESISGTYDSVPFHFKPGESKDIDNFSMVKSLLDRFPNFLENAGQVNSASADAEIASLKASLAQAQLQLEEATAPSKK